MLGTKRHVPLTGAVDIWYRSGLVESRHLGGMVFRCHGGVRPGLTMMSWNLTFEIFMMHCVTNLGFALLRLLLLFRCITTVSCRL